MKRDRTKSTTTKVDKPRINWKKKYLKLKEKYKKLREDYEFVRFLP